MCPDAKNCFFAHGESELIELPPQTSSQVPSHPGRSIPQNLPSSFQNPSLPVRPLPSPIVSSKPVYQTMTKSQRPPAQTRGAASSPYSQNNLEFGLSSLNLDPSHSEKVNRGHFNRPISPEEMTGSRQFPRPPRPSSFRNGGPHSEPPYRLNASNSGLEHEMNDESRDLEGEEYLELQGNDLDFGVSRTGVFDSKPSPYRERESEKEDSPVWSVNKSLSPKQIQKG